MKNKKQKSILIIVILLLVSFLSVYFLVIKKPPDKELVNTTNIETNNVEEITVEQGDKVVWESQRTEFYLPKGWSYQIATNNEFMENIILTGDDLTLTMEFIPVTDGSLWSKQDNILYETPTSVLYKDGEVYKAIFNATTTVVENDYESGESVSKEYGLFLTIKRHGVGLDSLSTEEFSYIKFILDSYNTENQ